MTRKIHTSAQWNPDGGLSTVEVENYLRSLGYTNIEVRPYEPGIILIEADLAGQHYIASSGSADSLNAAERIMTGYWVALNKDVPFAMPTDGTAQITDSWIKDQTVARDAEDDGYAATIDD